MSDIAPVFPLTMLAGTNRFGARDEGWALVGAPDWKRRRTFIGRITFEKPFAAAPVVHVGLTGFDIENHDAARLLIAASNITPEGFDLGCETWLGTQIWSVTVSWLALG